MLINNKFATTEEESQPNGSLLTPEEKSVCKQLVMGEAPHRQRAQALLAIDAGFTQGEAAMKSGLTKGQVRYWLGKFRQIRLNIFPKQVLGEKSTETKSLLGEATSDDILQLEEVGAPKPTKKKGKKKDKKKKADKEKPKNDVKGKKKRKKVKVTKENKAKKDKKRKKK